MWRTVTLLNTNSGREGKKTTKTLFLLHTHKINTVMSLAYMYQPIYKQYILRMTVSRPVLSWNKALVWGFYDQIFITLSCGYVDVGRSLWREDGSVDYNCCWPSAEQSFSGSSPVGLVTVFYCLRFETSFSSPPTTRCVTVEVFDPASTRGLI
jgi:hypothetical protein